MATVKEVAKEAGVSVGTVSNVLNGKTENAELIAKVEKAISKLNFRPNEKARSLKGTCSRVIGVLVGNFIGHSSFSLLAALEESLGRHGYGMYVRTTGDNEILEKKNMLSFMQHGVDGIIADMRHKESLQRYADKKQGIPVLYINNFPETGFSGNFLTVNYENALSDFIQWCRETGKKNVGIILCTGMVSRDRMERIQKTDGAKIVCRFCGRNTKEDGFKAAYEIMYEKGCYEKPDMVLCGSTELFQGARQAEEVFGRRDSILYSCIKKEDWIEDRGRFECILDISYRELGEKAAEMILESLSGKSAKAQFKSVSAVFKSVDHFGLWEGTKEKGKKKKLRAAILNSDTSELIRTVSEIYSEKHDPVSFQSYSYRELWELVSDPVRLEKERVDVVMYDLVWKQDLVKAGTLHRFKENDLSDPYYAGYLENVLESYGMQSGRLYGLPFLSGTQLLFYQRDLFFDEDQKRQFRQKYGYELSLPKTWEEFKNAAEFFTRKKNPNSPVRYGTSLINQGNVYAGICLLNLLWPLGADIVIGKSANLEDPMMQIALKQYKELLSFTSGEARENWVDIATEFKKGDTAMVILYDSIAYGINDPMSSKVAGNIGSAVIPGGCPVLGGWGLGVYKESRQTKEAEQFVKWVSGPECDSVYSILSGISNRKAFYLNREMDELYPWKKNVLESYGISRERKYIQKSQSFYDEVLGALIEKYLREC